MAARRAAGVSGAVVRRALGGSGLLGAVNIIISADLVDYIKWLQMLYIPL